MRQVMGKHWLFGIGLTVALLNSAASAHPGHDDPPTPSAPATAGEPPKSDVKIEVRGEYRYITANGIPDHETGKFPSAGNPGRITAQSFEFRVPVKPTVGDKPAVLGPIGRPPGPGSSGQRGGRPPMLFGVAVNGVVFDPGTAEWWKDDPTSGWHIEALPANGASQLGIDQNHAHVQPPTGTYHYHGVPTALVHKLAGEEAGKKMVLVGWAADGFPVYAKWGYAKPDDAKSPVAQLRSGYRLKSGERAGGDKGPGGKFDGTYVEDYEFQPGLGDLDEFNGRTGVTPEFADGTYYYVLTEEFPFVPRTLRSVPDESFRKGPPRGGRGEQPRRGEPHPGGEGEHR